MSGLATPATRARIIAKTSQHELGFDQFGIERGKTE
jgi:hypothetical protein